MSRNPVLRSSPLVVAALGLATLICPSANAKSPKAAPATFHRAVARSPAAGTIFLYPERIPLEEGGFFAAERGMMFVPANRSESNSAVIAIEVYRFRASERAKVGTPPVFFLHGGPSFQGLEEQLQQLGTFEEKWRPYLDVSDLIVVGQRGIGSSKPTTTIETSVAPRPLDRQYDEAEASEEFRRACAREREFWVSQGLDLRGFNIIEAAADVDDVRKALGYDKITIWGGSFGSHWGMAVMRYYPEIVERAVLRGMEGPDHTYDHPGHLWNVYKRVAEEAERAPELQAFIPAGGLIKAIARVIQQIKSHPVEVTAVDPKTGEPRKVLFSEQRAADLARGYSGELRAWPADVIRLHRGDFSGAAARAVERWNDPGRSFTTASFFLLDCGSGITPGRLAQYDEDPAVEIIGPLSWAYRAGCPVWQSDLGDEFRESFETHIPTVIVHGTWDTSTPYENALELLPFFKNSTFVPVIRGPHGAIRAAVGASELFRRGIMTFAATGDASGLPESVEMPPVQWVIPDDTREQKVEPVRDVR